MKKKSIFNPKTYNGSMKYQSKRQINDQPYFSPVTANKHFFRPYKMADKKATQLPD